MTAENYEILYSDALKILGRIHNSVGERYVTSEGGRFCTIDGAPRSDQQVLELAFGSHSRGHIRGT